MVHPAGGHSAHHHVRFYIVMVTLVVGGIFILLLANNDGDGFSITNAIVSSIGNTTEKADDAAETTATTSTTKTSSPSKRVDMILAFDKVPTFKEEAKVKNMQLRFDDSAAEIKVNNDKLELSNLNEVALVIEDFKGTVDFQGVGFSIKGTAKRLEVNDVALSAGKEIAISFSNLGYDYLYIDEIELKDLQLERGSGELVVGERLQQQLDGDKVFIDSFDGEFLVDKAAEETLQLQGLAQGIRVRGDDLNVNLG